MDIDHDEFVPYCSSYGHSAIAGMMHVHDDDLDTVADMRRANGDQPIECERCDATYRDGRWVG